jgi:hypothetical protein
MRRVCDVLMCPRRDVLKRGVTWWAAVVVGRVVAVVGPAVVWQQFGEVGGIVLGSVAPGG